MTRKAGKSHSAVERLIEQRRQYKDWLAKLDAEAATAAPSHVADRVREDYAARLEAVTEELKQHEDGVRQALVESASHVEELVQERQARTDELAEARLRRQVGEFSEDRFEEVQTRCKGALNELTKEIATNERDIERFEEVLALIQGKPVEEPPRAVAPPPAPAAAPPKAAEAPAATAAPPPAPPPAATKPAQGGQMNLDELEFLRSVTESPRTPGPARPSFVASAVPAAAAPPSAPAQAPEVPTPPPPPPKAAEPPPAPKPVAPPPPPLPPPPAAAPPPAPKAKERRPSEPAREAEANAKTLKCGECGTMNPPTEWYCEKCGAELSTF